MVSKRRTHGVLPAVEISGISHRRSHDFSSVLMGHSMCRIGTSYGIYDGIIGIYGIYIYIYNGYNDI